MALVREVLGRSRAIPAGAASLSQDQTSRSLGSEQTPCDVCSSPGDGSGGVSCFVHSRDPSPGSAPGLPQQPGLRGRGAAREGLGCVGRTGTGRQHCTKHPVLFLGVIPNY